MIRPSVTVRMVNVTFVVAALAFIVVLAVVALNDDKNGGPGIAVVFLTPALPVVFALYRGLSAVVVADPRGLLVRNMYGTWRFAWHEIEDFRLGAPVTNFTRGLAVLLRNGEMITMYATERAWSSESHSLMLAGLRAWLWRPRNEPPPPFGRT